MHRLNFSAAHRLSLQRTLLLVLFPGMLLAAGAELWLTWRTAVGAANAAYDRSLLGAIKAMDSNISTESGGLGVELPYRMLEFFELTANGRVYYRVSTEDGLVDIGNADLPAPPASLITGQPQFSDAVYFGEPLRIGSYARTLPKPLAGLSTAQRVVIQVAETLESRHAFTRALLLEALARDLLLVFAATGLLALVVAWALRPLRRLNDEVRARSPQDLAPISTCGIPADVRPLVDAINHHVERTRRQTEARRRFVDDASHQLRTPLATLKTQVGFALRETDLSEQRDALVAIDHQLEEMARQTNQMLALARSENIELAFEPVELNQLAERTIRAWWSTAREHGIDLGIEPARERLMVSAHAGLLHEALSNLLHNAIRYTPQGGEVTVVVERTDDRGSISVIDNGPGIPAAERQRAGERFFRGSNVAKPGSGLGLAIARSIVERCGGELRIEAAPNGRGLTAVLVLDLVDTEGISKGFP